MKKIITILCLVCFSTCSLFSQWTYVNTGTSTEVYNVSFYGSSDIFLSGNGRLVKSINSGSSWTTLTLKDLVGNAIPMSFLYDTHFFDSNTGVATGLITNGNSEVILRTTNGGANWATVSTNNSGSYPRLIYDLNFPTSTVGYAAGSNGRILKTTDAGLTWNAQTSGTSNDLKSVFFNDANNGFIAGENLILKTSDGGSTWTVASSNSYILNSIYFCSSTVGFAVGNNNIILKTTDGGNNWVVKQTSITSVFNDVYMIDADTAFIASNDGIYKTVNGGDYWVLQPSAPSSQFDAVSFSPNNVGYTTGTSGKVYRTSTYGDIIPKNDAGITYVKSYSNICPDTLPVNIKIKNYGLNNLTSATVNWSVNGVLQSPYFWTGLLQSDSTTVEFTIDNYFFDYGTSIVKVWTINPNGQSDGYSENDTTSGSFTSSKLHGTYTIGGSSPDFSTFTAANNALSYGLCTPVVFKVRNGIYNEQLSFALVNDASSVNTITFESELGDSTAVSLTSSGTTITFNASSRYITFKGIAINSSGNTAIELKSGASYINISNCHLVAQTSATTLIKGNSANNIEVSNCFFYGGSYGFSMTGTSSSYGIGISVDNNRFVDQDVYSISLSYQRGPEISSNTITTTTANFDGSVYLFFCDGGYKILSNKISVSNVSVKLWSSSCSQGNEALIANNFLKNGFSISNSRYLNIFHNSVIANTLNTISFTYNINDTLSKYVNLMNNIFVNNGNGYVIEVYAPYVNSDYSKVFKTINKNCYFYSNNKLATVTNDVFSDIIEWKALIIKVYVVKQICTICA